MEINLYYKFIFQIVIVPMETKTKALIFKNKKNYSNLIVHIYSYYSVYSLEQLHKNVKNRSI